MRWGSEQLPPDEKEEERKDGEGEWDEGRGEVDQSQPHWQWQHTPFPALTHVSSFTSQDHSDAGLQPKHTHTHTGIHTFNWSERPCWDPHWDQQGFPPTPWWCHLSAMFCQPDSHLWGEAGTGIRASIPCPHKEGHTMPQLPVSSLSLHLLHHFWFVFKVYQDCSFCTIQIWLAHK